MSLLVGRNRDNSQEVSPQSEQSIGSSALQKALERNRAKQLEKTQKENGPDLFDSEEPEVRPSISIEDKLKQLKASPSPNLTLPPPRPSTTTLPIFNKTESSNLSFGLKRVDLVKTKITDFKSNFFGHVLKVMWIFSLILFLRLIFVERGILEFYFRRQRVQEKIEVYDKQVATNKKLKKEIERIERDVTYQKSLVRNNLGFIADDEYIIVLPESRARF